jgi:parallel beta-helix repeat protein
MQLKDKLIFLGVISLAMLLGFRGVCRAKVLRVPAEYPTIQGAIDAAQAGDTVEVAPGTYYETIVLKEWVTVRSEGTEREHRDHTAARRTIIDGGGKLKPVVEGADGAVLDGFTLTGLRKVDHHIPGHPHGVQCRGTSPIIINNIIHHMGSTGIGSHVMNGRPAAPYIANNIVYANQGLGIGNNHDSAATIIGNRVYDNTESGIGARNGAHPLIADNIVYSNGWVGIGARDGGFPTIVNNRVYNNGQARLPDRGAGIGIKAAYVPLLEGNTIYSNRFAGIGMRRKASAVIRNNQSYHNGYAGIGLDAAVSVLIENNHIYGNGKAGIGMTNNSSAVITGNHIHHNVNAGISPRTEHNVVMGNNNLHDNGEPFSGEPPEMTRPDYNPLTGVKDEQTPPPPGLPSPSFFEWTKQKNQEKKKK